MTAVEGPVSDDIVRRLDACTNAGRLLAEQEEGPYRRGERPHRRDVTEGRAGSALTTTASGRPSFRQETAGDRREGGWCLVKR